MGLGLIARSQGLLLAEALSEQGTVQTATQYSRFRDRAGSGCCCDLRQGQPKCCEFHGGRSDCRCSGSTGMRHGDDAPSIKHEWRPRGCIALRRQPSGNSVSVLAIREPYFRDKLRRRKATLPIPIARAVGPELSRSGGSKLYGRYEQHLFKLRREAAKEQIESEIRYFLRN